MERPVRSSRKDTLVAFRIPSKDIEFFKRRAEAEYRRGDIKTPTIAALCKRNLYWTCNILNDLDKAGMSLDEQSMKLGSYEHAALKYQRLQFRS